MTPVRKPTTGRAFTKSQLHPPTVSRSCNSIGHFQIACFFRRTLLITAVLAATPILSASAQEKPEPPLARAPTYKQVMNRLAQPFLDQRSAAMAKIQTKEQADARQAELRAKLLRLLGAGERLQAMNQATGKSWTSPDEHSQAQIPISPHR
jgi:hypothetical protein